MGYPQLRPFVNAAPADRIARRAMR